MTVNDPGNKEIVGVAILPGTITEYESAGRRFVNLKSLETRIEGDKVIFGFEVELDFSRLTIQPGKVQVIAQAKEGR